MQDILIGVGREGVLIERDFPEKSKNWKNKIHFREGVIEGIGRINKNYPAVKIYMFSNQSKILGVNRYILGQLYKKEARIDGWFEYPRVDKALEHAGFKSGLAEIFMIGDKFDEIEPVIKEMKIRGHGIIIKNPDMPYHERERMRKCSLDISSADDFRDAVDYLENRLKYIVKEETDKNAI